MGICVPYQFVEKSLSVIGGKYAGGLAVKSGICRFVPAFFYEWQEGFSAYDSVVI